MRGYACFALIDWCDGTLGSAPREADAAPRYLADASLDLGRPVSHDRGVVRSRSRAQGPRECDACVPARLDHEVSWRGTAGDAGDRAAHGRAPVRATLAC